MAQLEDKINTTLDQVISSDWRGQGRGGSAGAKGGRKKKGSGRGASKEGGRGVLGRTVKGAGKKAGGGKGGNAGAVRVKKTLFGKKRRSEKASGKGGADRDWAKGNSKGKGTGKLKKRRLSKGKGKGKGKWSEREDNGYTGGGQRSWREDSWKGKGGGEGKGKRLKRVKGKGKGTGKLRSKGKGKKRGMSQDNDGYQVRRSIEKRQPRMRLRGIDKGKGTGLEGMARGFAIATREGGRKGWGKAAGQGAREREQRRERRGGGADRMGRISPDDERMMKKITIVAQLDKVPKPTPAMQGFNMGRSRNERGGSLSRRFASRDR